MSSTFTGTVSREELLRFVDDLRVHISEGRAPVYHISNSLGLENVELSLKGLYSLIKSLPMFGALGWQIDVNQHPVNKMLAAIGSQFANVRTRTVPRLEDAVEFLRHIDDELAEAHWPLPESSQP